MDCKKQNFLSADKQTARTSHGEYFQVGESTKHEGAENEVAKIISFEFNEKYNEIKVNTDRGHCHLDFLVKHVPIFVGLSVDFLLSPEDDLRLASKYVSLKDKDGKEIVSGEIYRTIFQNEEGEECDEDGVVL